MKKQHFYIESSDDTQQLHYVVWEPESSPVGVLQLVHGMEEYIDRYDSFANAMVQDGWCVIGHDHLGHGQSGKWERGFFSEMRNADAILIDDILLITNVAKQRWPRFKVFLFAHSMGSFFARLFLARYPNTLSGIIICGSGWYPPIATGTAYLSSLVIGNLVGMHKKSKLLKYICSLPFLFAYRKEGTNAWLSKNHNNVMQYEADPLCGFGFTCGGYRDMYCNLYHVSKESNYEKLQPLPLLIISGADDPVGGKRAVSKIAKQYFSRGFHDVTSYAIEGDRHEILFEDDAGHTINYISNWLNARV